MFRRTKSYKIKDYCHFTLRLNAQTQRFSYECIVYNNKHLKQKLANNKNTYTRKKMTKEKSLFGNENNEIMRDNYCRKTKGQ